MFRGSCYLWPAVSWHQVSGCNFELHALDFAAFSTIPKIEHSLRYFNKLKTLQTLCDHEVTFVGLRKRIVIQHYYYACQSVVGISLIDF